MLTLEIKICRMQIEKEKKKYVKNFSYKRKKLLNLLINCTEELENFYLSL